MVEFAFMVPILIGMIVLLREIEIAINTGIVQQKYARATMHFLMFNHAHYPEVRFKSLPNNPNYIRRWWIGVDENSNFREGGETGEDVLPVAPKRKIGRVKPPDDDTAGVEVSSRQNVRVRTTSFICVPPFGNTSGQAFSENHLSSQQFSGGNYDYCND